MKINILTITAIIFSLSACAQPKNIPKYSEMNGIQKELFDVGYITTDSLISFKESVSNQELCEERGEKMVGEPFYSTEYIMQWHEYRYSEQYRSCFVLRKNQYLNNEDGTILDSAVLFDGKTLEPILEKKISDHDYLDLLSFWDKLK